MLATLLSLIAAASDGTDILNTALPIANLGLAGIFLWAFIKRILVPGSLYNEQVELTKEKEKQNQELQAKINNDVIPALARAHDMHIALGNLVERIMKFIESADRKL